MLLERPSLFTFVTFLDRHESFWHPSSVIFFFLLSMRKFPTRLLMDSDSDLILFFPDYRLSSHLIASRNKTIVSLKYQSCLIGHLRTPISCSYASGHCLSEKVLSCFDSSPNSFSAGYCLIQVTSVAATHQAIVFENSHSQCSPRTSDPLITTYCGHSLYMLQICMFLSFLTHSLSFRP